MNRPPNPRIYFLAGLLSLVATPFVGSVEAESDQAGGSSDAGESADSTRGYNQGDPTEATDVAGEVSCPEGYSLRFIVRPLEQSSVRVDLFTDIPGTVEIMLDISLSGQEDDDVWIGVDDRVRLANGVGSHTFDVSGIPRGSYDVEASFYPAWGLIDSQARASAITSEMEAVAQIDLAGSGESSDAAAFREEGQKWVMLNVHIGSEWNPDDWADRFGEAEPVQMDRGNPRILAAYYFPSIDMTVISNTLKREIAIYRVGRARH